MPASECAGPPGAEHSAPPSQPAFPLLVKTLCDLAPIGEQREILFSWKKRRKVRLPSYLPGAC